MYVYDAKEQKIQIKSNVFFLLIYSTNETETSNVFRKNMFWKKKMVCWVRSQLNWNHHTCQKKKSFIIILLFFKFIIHLFLIRCLAWLPLLILVPLTSFWLWTSLNMSAKFFMIICPYWLIHLMNAVAVIENKAELAYSN